jgi:hypothetical protein
MVGTKRAGLVRVISCETPLVRSSDILRQAAETIHLQLTISLIQVRERNL